MRQGQLTISVWYTVKLHFDRILHITDVRSLAKGGAEMVRIVHAPTEIAGQMGTLIDGLRQAGLQAWGYNWFHTYLNYHHDYVIKSEAYELKRMVDPVVRHADVFHFHNGNSFLVENRDIPLLHAAGKKMIMHHWGNDVRTGERSRQLNPYPVPANYMSDEEISRRLKFISSYIEHAIVQDYELYPHVSDYYKHVHVLPLACRVMEIPFEYPLPDIARPRIIHAPTNREFKGSEYVERAIAALQGKVPFEYETIEKLSHKEAMKRYLEADIIIDQIVCGTYGMLSVEAMAMGKPVIAFVRDDVRSKLPVELPIIIANPDTIHDVLFDLLREPGKLHQTGVASRAYAERVHDVRRVIPQLVDIYKQVLGRE